MYDTTPTDCPFGCGATIEFQIDVDAMVTQLPNEDTDSEQDAAYFKCHSCNRGFLSWMPEYKTCDYCGQEIKGEVRYVDCGGYCRKFHADCVEKWDR